PAHIDACRAVETHPHEFLVRMPDTLVGAALLRALARYLHAPGAFARGTHLGRQVRDLTDGAALPAQARRARLPALLRGPDMDRLHDDAREARDLDRGHDRILVERTDFRARQARPVSGRARFPAAARGVPVDG